MAELTLPVETISVSGSLTIASNTKKDASSFNKIAKLQDALKAELENFAPNINELNVTLSQTASKSEEVSYRFKIEGTILMTDPMLVAEGAYSNAHLIFNGYLNGEDIIHFLNEALDNVMFGTNERWKRYAETTGDKSKLDETFSVIADDLDHLMFEDQIFPRIRLLNKYDEAERTAIINSWVDDYMSRDLTDLGIDNAAKLAIVKAISDEKDKMAATAPGPEIDVDYDEPEWTKEAIEEAFDMMGAMIKAAPGVKMKPAAGKTAATLAEAAKYASPTAVIPEFDDLDVDELER